MSRMRITGGALRSRLLVAPRGTGTRPTADRVREALFSILGSAGAVEGARVLDLFAGTGALAFEALSRGAASATLVESSREALAAIAANVQALDLGARVRVVAAPVLRALARLEGEFDLVLVDPPYADVASGGAGRVLEALVARGLVAPGGAVVLEHAQGDPPPRPAALELGSTRRYGDSALTLYRMAS